jgi:hypothetical protein
MLHWFEVKAAAKGLSPILQLSSAKLRQALGIQPKPLSNLIWIFNVQEVSF